MTDVRASTARSATAGIISRCGSITRTPTFPAWSITRAICASWSAAAPTICACSAPTSARCSRRRRRRRRASPSWCARCRSISGSPRAWTTFSRSSPRTAEVKGASVVLHQRVDARRRNAGGRQGAGRLCLRRAGAADPEAACASPCKPIRTQQRPRSLRSGRRRGPRRDVNALHMSWSKHGGGKSRGEQPRGYHHGNLKEALIRAALELIAQKGPAGFTFAEAARWAGVSPAAPYRHYRDRDELISDVASRASFASSRRSCAPGTRASRNRRKRSTAWARRICTSRAPSPPTTRRCSRPAFRSTPIPNSVKPATARSTSCARRPK